MEGRACYVAVPLYICGSVLLGATFQKHLSTGALVIGWGIAEFSVMTGTVAVCTCVIFICALFDE